MNKYIIHNRSSLSNTLIMTLVIAALAGNVLGKKSCESIAGDKCKLSIVRNKKSTTFIITD
jgi:hypothetical protein